MKEKKQKRKRRTPIPTYTIKVHNSIDNDEFVRATLEMVERLITIQAINQKNKTA